MGLLDGLFGGSGQQSSMSPLIALLLGVLAYRTYQGKGRLADMLGRSMQRSRTSPAISRPATRRIPAGAWAICSAAPSVAVVAADLAVASAAALEGCSRAARPAAFWAAG
jgi:hypothetical protein